MRIRKLWLAAVAGHILERYEVTIYGFYATILAPIFFPSKSAKLSLFFSLATFAAGYVMRPLGGIIFGHIGDKMGRRTALVSSILLVTVPTLIIGSLPTYNQIGLFAPMILILCRLLQGLCVGGEYSGAAVFFFEHAKPNFRGLAGSIMSATAFLGAVLGTLVGSFTTYFYTSDFIWRLPFLLGGISGIVIYFFRKSMDETPEFKNVREKSEMAKIPLVELFKSDKTNMLYSFLFSAQGHIVLYMTTIYMNTIMIKSLNLEEHKVMLLNTFILMLWIILMPVFGLLADKFNKFYMVFIISLGLCSFSYPLFFFINSNFCLLNVALAEIVLSFMGAALVAVIPSLLPQLFKTRNRYTGVALGQTLGQALLGGTSPLIATYLSAYVGMTNAPLILLIFSGVLGLIGSVLSILQNTILQHRPWSLVTIISPR